MGGPLCTPASAVVRRGPQGEEEERNLDGWVGGLGEGLQGKGSGETGKVRLL